MTTTAPLDGSHFATAAMLVTSDATTSLGSTLVEARTAAPDDATEIWTIITTPPAATATWP